MARAEDKTVLIVEDEPDVRLFLQTVVEDAGFNVETASDGEEALEKIREKKPDFISLDLVLPKKSGHKLLHELKKDNELAQIPVLIVTAHAKDALGKGQMEEILKDPVLLGPGMFLEKPVNPLNYIRCIKRSLGIEETKGTEEKIKLKEDLRHIIDESDADTLRRALKELQKEK